MEHKASVQKSILFISSIAITLIIYVLSSALSSITLPNVYNLIDINSFAEKNFVVKLYMLVFTLIVMLIIRKKTAADYGFTRGHNLSYGLYLKKGILFGLLGLAAVIIVNVIGFAVTRQRPVGFPSESLLKTILFIWIWSSVVEEILFRGLLQSWLSTPNQGSIRIGKLNLSSSVLLSALLFAGLHLSLMFKGMSPFFICGIFIHAFILGLVAGYYREKTGSLYPAILLHIIFNIVGSLPLLLSSL